MLARDDRAMQSAARRARSAPGAPAACHGIPPDHLVDRSRGHSGPRTCRGDAPRAGHRDPRQALLYLPFRYDDLSEILARPSPGRREAVSPGSGGGHPVRARLRASAAADDRPDRGRQRLRGCRVVRPAVRRAADRSGRRDHRVRQGETGRRRAQFQSPEFSPAGRLRFIPLGLCRYTGSPRVSPSGVAASSWRACWPPRFPGWKTR